MMPPPRTTSRRGTSVWASRPVESTQSVESSPGIGGRIGNEPVATIAERERDVLAALDRDRVRVLERARALDPLDAVRLEERRDAAGHLLDDAGLPLVRGGEVELRLVDGDAELGERVARLVQRSARSAPRPWSGCTRRAGTCRRARAPSRCTRPSRRAAPRGSPRCSRRARRPGRRRHSPSRNRAIVATVAQATRTILPNLPPAAKALVGGLRLARAGTSAATGTRAGRRRAAARTSRSSRATTCAFSSSERARSVDAVHRAALAHQQARSSTSPARPRRCRSRRAARRGRAAPTSRGRFARRRRAPGSRRTRPVATSAP